MSVAEGTAWMRTSGWGWEVGVVGAAAVVSCSGGIMIGERER